MTFYLPPKAQLYFKGRAALKSDQIAEWIAEMWTPRHAADTPVTVWTDEDTVNAAALAKLDLARTYDGFVFTGHAPVDCDIVNRLNQVGRDGVIGERCGGFALAFAAPDGSAFEVFVANAQYSDDGCTVTLAAVPERFLKGWRLFSYEASRLAAARDETDQVVIIGGTENSFIPTVEWDDIVLPEELKADLLGDIRAFFSKGVEVYTRLNLKPFRKLLLAGVPGTGKTMLCNAIARWALAEGMLVIYVSSARKRQEDETGSAFWKIERALHVAAYSERPALVLLEEMDAYLHEAEKALILNVLDGSETPVNPRGTLLIATTNYPEAIDERVLKRPGRLDRVLVIPAVQAELDAELMLRRYLGGMWQDSHLEIVPQLVGYPGAFVRELAIYALTYLAYEDLTSLPVELLQSSLDSLQAQIEARDSLAAGRQTGPETAAQPA